MMAGMSVWFPAPPSGAAIVVHNPARRMALANTGPAHPTVTAMVMVRANTTAGTAVPGHCQLEVVWTFC